MRKDPNLLALVLIDPIIVLLSVSGSSWFSSRHALQQLTLRRPATVMIAERTHSDNPFQAEIILPDDKLILLEDAS